MRIIQTSWAGNQKDLLKHRAGWYSPEYHLMAWALSCLQLKKYYPEVILHADSVNAKMMIDILKLPYTEVICDLDQFNDNSPDLWALPKIHAYSKQTRPFLHVDGDVFIWSPFDEDLLQGKLIAQNMEVGTAYYDTLFKDLESELIYRPSEIRDERKKNKKIYTYNAGIFGGNDLSFFNSYTAGAMDLIRKNSEILTKIRIPTFNIYYEQFLFYCLTENQQVKVNVLFNEIIPDNQYIGFGDFTETPHHKQYLHLIGIYKRTQNVCQQLANKLRKYYPEYYYRIIALFKNNGLPLKKDYYHFFDHPTEKYLTDRYLNLKNGHDLPMVFSNEHNTAGQIKVQSKSQSKIVENVSAAILIKNKELQSPGEFDKILEDAQLFETRLSTIIANEFSQLSNDLLYRRDITHTNYFEYIFADKITSYAKKIASDKRVQIIQSSYDWSRFDTENTHHAYAQSLNLDEYTEDTYLCVIPECHDKGYSLINIDALDRQLLELVEETVTIRELLIQIQSAFDAKDIEDSRSEFEQLIIGRLKFMLQAKIIESVL